MSPREFARDATPKAKSPTRYLYRTKKTGIKEERVRMCYNKSGITYVIP